MNRKRCGDGAELSYVGYARVNSSVFSLALKVPRVLAVLVFTVSWFQTVGAIISNQIIIIMTKNVFTSLSSPTLSMTTQVETEQNVKTVVDRQARNHK